MPAASLTADHMTGEIYDTDPPRRVVTDFSLVTRAYIYGQLLHCIVPSSTRKHEQTMAPSLKNLSAAVFLLLVVTAAARMDAESSASVIGDYSCGHHLSGNYKGACWLWINDDDCKRVCVDESSDNNGGLCVYFQCWCQTGCTSETVAAAASAPIRQ